jgi:hypothetical protein
MPGIRLSGEQVSQIISRHISGEANRDGGPSLVKVVKYVSIYNNSPNYGLIYETMNPNGYHESPFCDAVEVIWEAAKGIQQR